MNTKVTLPQEDLDFIGDTIVPREVEYKGKKKTFFFREMEAGLGEDLFATVLGADGQIDPTKQKGFRDRSIAAMVCNEDGLQRYTVDQARILPSKLAQMLQTIGLEVNGAGGEKKVLPPANDNGTSSPASSDALQSIDSSAK